MKHYSRYASRDHYDETYSKIKLRGRVLVGLHLREECCCTQSENFLLHVRTEY